MRRPPKSWRGRSRYAHASGVTTVKSNCCCPGRLLSPTRQHLLLALRNLRLFLGTKRSKLHSSSMPTLASLSDRCEQATGILMQRRTELAAKPAASGDSLARIDAMLAAFASSAARGKIDRATTDRHRCYGGQNVRRNEVRLSFRSHTPIAFDRISRHRWQP